MGDVCSVTARGGGGGGGEGGEGLRSEGGRDLPECLAGTILSAYNILAGDVSSCAKAPQGTFLGGDDLGHRLHFTLSALCAA